MIEAHLAATVQTANGTFPVFVHTIERPEGLVLVDTAGEGAVASADFGR
jgi:hypothetical protein